MASEFNDTLRDKYLELTKECSMLYLVGRLAEYCYCDMNDIVLRSLNLFEEQVVKY